MKKFFKFVVAIAAICAGVAGGMVLYSKYKEKQDDDLDDDYDDDFSDDDDDETDRSYVKINPDKAEEAAKKAED